MSGVTSITAATSVRTFEASIRPLMPHLLGYFTRRVIPTADAADCLSDTLVVLWRRRNDLPAADEELRAWSFGIARGVLANHLRSQRRQSRLAARLREYLARSPPPVRIDQGLTDALATLSDADKELVLLVAWDGFGVGEAGDLLGLTPEAARARYSRARKALRAELC